MLLYISKHKGIKNNYHQNSRHRERHAVKQIKQEVQHRKNDIQVRQSFQHIYKYSHYQNYSALLLFYTYQ